MVEGGAKLLPAVFFLVSYKLKKKASEMLLLLESRLQPESKQVGFASTERMYTKNNHKTLKMYLVASSF